MKNSIKSYNFTLLYGGEVLSWSCDGEVLLEEKAELIYSRAVRYPELLEICFDGYLWLFDRKFDRKTALLYLVWRKLGYPYAVKQRILLEKS